MQFCRAFALFFLIHLTDFLISYCSGRKIGKVGSFLTALRADCEEVAESEVVVMSAGQHCQHWHRRLTPAPQERNKPFFSLAVNSFHIHHTAGYI